MTTDDIKMWQEAWDSLDEDEERLAIEAHNEITDIGPIAVDIKGKHKEHKAKNKVVLTGYKGPTLPEVLTAEAVEALRTAFTEGQKLHYYYAYQIVKQAKHAFLAANCSVNEITVSEGGRIVVVGDLHGQLPDLLTILKRAGVPSKTNMYLFNGDFVDRGPHGPEVLFLILAYKVLYPDHVFLNRGNHEAKHMNAKYNFEEQVVDSYDYSMYQKIHKVFELLPVCAVIDKKIFVVHGGLTQYGDLTIDDIKKEIKSDHALPRHKVIKHSDVRGDWIMEQLIWSDPREIQGWTESSRGAGINFGSDITNNFLEKNNLELVIRSHEKVQEGYDYAHANLITVFSASYYCSRNDNKGCVVALAKDKGLKPEFIQYIAEVFDTAHVSTTCKQDTLQMLRDRIFQNRHALMVEFSKYDPELSAYITEQQWEDALQSVLKLNIAFKLMRPYLAKLHDDDFVCYVDFLDRYQISLNESIRKDWEDEMVKHICEKFLLHTTSLRLSFNEIDKNGDEQLDYNEFVEVLKQYNLGLSHEQMYDLMVAIDVDRSGTISYQEFLDRFSVTFSNASIQDDDMEWMEQALTDMGLVLAQEHSDLSIKEIYEEFDRTDTGGVSYDDFALVLKRIGLDKYDKAQRMKIAAYVDTNDSGNISLREFKTALHVNDEKSDEWSMQILRRLCVTMFKHKNQIVSIFHMMDVDNSKTLDKEEFMAAMQLVNKLLPDKKGISEMQIKTLFNMAKQNGEIEYRTFLAMFEVVDAHELADKKLKNINMKDMKVLDK